MLRLFTDNLLPIFIAAGVGYLLAARGRVDPRPLTKVAFHLFSPCLIYQVIVDNRLDAASFLRMSAFALAVLLTLGAAAGLAGRLCRWSRPVTAAVMLTVLFPNAGNFGLSANLFAFGQEGLAQASLFFVTSGVLSYTLGAFVASAGRAGIRQSLMGLPKTSTVWAVLFAFVALRLGWDLPLPVARTVHLFADACIPVFLVILGMQLRGASWRGVPLPLAVAAGTRLLGGIAAGLLFAPVFLEGAVARQAGVLEAAMPSAVICIILATEYDVEPGFVTAVVVTTTLLSPLTLTPLLAYLGA